MNTNEYKQQANDFLNATSTALTAKFTRHGKHFSSDKESRDIFKVMLKNKLHTYRFNFGQSINKSTGTGANTPSAYDVLACLTCYSPGTFENFCGDYGYDLDSRSAYKTYKEVMKEYKNLELLFTPEQLEQLSEIN
jgi:hypothetical protein